MRHLSFVTAGSITPPTWSRAAPRTSRLLCGSTSYQLCRAKWSLSRDQVGSEGPAEVRGARRVMLVDPSGLGWVLKTGDFVGKAELVTAGGTSGADVAINWRIDRIRSKDVVFIREDAAHPEIPPTTRVMYLRPGEDSTRG